MLSWINVYSLALRVILSLFIDLLYDGRRHLRSHFIAAIVFDSFCIFGTNFLNFTWFLFEIFPLASNTNHSMFFFLFLQRIEQIALLLLLLLLIKDERLLLIMMMISIVIICKIESCAMGECLRLPGYFFDFELGVAAGMLLAITHSIDQGGLMTQICTWNSTCKLFYLFVFLYRLLRVEDYLVKPVHLNFLETFAGLKNGEMVSCGGVDLFEGFILDLKLINLLL